MNNVVLIGNIANDLELRYTTGERQIAVLKFSLAVNRVGGKNETDFIRVAIFGKQAENTQNYCKKGSKIGVQGRIQTGSYKNKDGQTVYTTDVIADRVEFLSWKEKETQLTDGDLSSVYSETAKTLVDMMVPEFSEIDEDIPF